MHPFNRQSRDQILSALGLQTRRGLGDMLMPALGMFGVGLVAGAGLGLLFAPKSGAQTREAIGNGIGKVTRRVTEKMRSGSDDALDDASDDAFEVRERPDGVTARSTERHSRNNGASTGPKA